MFLVLFCIFVFLSLFILLFCASELLLSNCFDINSSATLVFLTLWLFLDVKLPLVSSLSPQTQDNPLAKENKSFCYNIPILHNQVAHHVTYPVHQWVCVIHLSLSLFLSLSLSLSLYKPSNILLGQATSVVVALVQKD